MGRDAFSLVVECNADIALAPVALRNLRRLDEGEALRQGNFDLGPELTLGDVIHAHLGFIDGMIAQDAALGLRSPRAERREEIPLAPHACGSHVTAFDTRCLGQRFDLIPHSLEAPTIHSTPLSCAPHYMQGICPATRESVLRQYGQSMNALLL